MTEPKAETSGDGDPFRILFVCTGNTCRSPMAAVLTRSSLEQRGWKEVEVSSAGVGAFPGMPPSEGAVRALERRGLTLEGHASRPLLHGDVEEADVVLAMSRRHLEVIQELGGEAKGALITAFARGREGMEAELPGVSDPVGGDDEVYERVCSELEDLVEEVLSRLEPVISP